MSYIFMTYHYPKPEHRSDLLKGMAEMREIMAQHPGFIDAGPWEEIGSDRIVGISVWESRKAFVAAMPPGFGQPNNTIHEWEERPREPLHLVRWEKGKSGG